MRGHRTGSRGKIATSMLGLWAIIALCSCSNSPPDPRTGQEEPQLFRAAYRAITSRFLEPITAEALALAGLERLTAVDPSVAVTHSGRTVALSQANAIISQWPAPGPDDVDGWAELTGTLLKTARDRSAAVTALSTDRLDETVIDGSIELLDRFSRYAPPVLAAEHRDNRDGYGGIGVTVDAQGPDVRIVMVMPESPAAGVGLAPGDRIAAVDGIDAIVLSHDEVMERLRGPVGSNLKLTVARDGAPAPLSFTLQRSHIVVKTVSLAHDDHVAVLRISVFNAGTADNLAELVAQAHREMGSAFQGIVLDLRDNPGGLLDQSIRVASEFLDSGTVVSTAGRIRDADQQFDVYGGTVPVERLPLVVLVNGGSASASEIVAASLQDHGRAVIVGTASYGKGTVQNVIRLPNNGELTLTWARLIPPGGYILHEHGVVPAVCTADLSDPAKAKQISSRPLAELDSAAWDALRDRCPPKREVRDVDLAVAKRLLRDPGQYTQALQYEPAVAAPKPVRSASVAQVVR
jgi:carboxyl-terminal processing protease